MDNSPTHGCGWEIISFWSREAAGLNPARKTPRSRVIFYDWTACDETNNDCMLEAVHSSITGFIGRDSVYVSSLFPCTSGVGRKTAAERGILMAQVDRREGVGRWSRMYRKLVTPSVMTERTISSSNCFIPPFNPIASSVECHDSLPYLSPTLLNPRFTAWVRGLKKRLSKSIDTCHQSTRATLRMPTTRP
jgi:hypothetical protein